MERTTALTLNSDWIENPVTRCACMLALDVSSSMDGDPIRQLNDGVRRFLAGLQDDEFASQSIELGIITFGDRVEVTLPITPVPLVKDVAEMSANGCTPLSKAVEMSLQALEERKNEYQRAGISYYQPWLVLLSDGAPTDSWESVAAKCRALSEQRELVVVPVGVGDWVDQSILGSFSPCGAKQLAGLHLRQFFQWLSVSMSCVSQSTPGTGVRLPPTSGWEHV